MNLLLDQLVRKYEYGRITTLFTKGSYQNLMNPVHRLSSPFLCSVLISAWYQPLLFQVPSLYHVIRPGHIYSMWPTNLNLLDPNLWRPYTISRAVIPNRLFIFSVPLICRLFDILQSLVRHCKVHTQWKILKRYRNIYEANSGIYLEKSEGT
jgi:hypothetical protein